MRRRRPATEISGRCVFRNTANGLAIFSYLHVFTHVIVREKFVRQHNVGICGAITINNGPNKTKAMVDVTVDYNIIVTSPAH